MTANKELHPRSDTARMYVSRENGGREAIGCENNVKIEENYLGWYNENNIEPFLVTVKTSRIITQEEIVYPKEFKKTKEEQIKNVWTVKIIHRQFDRDMESNVEKKSLYGLTIWSTISTELLNHPFVGCVVQEMRLYLIWSVNVANLP